MDDSGKNAKDPRWRAALDNCHRIQFRVSPWMVERLEVLLAQWSFGAELDSSDPVTEADLQNVARAAFAYGLEQLVKLLPLVRNRSLKMFSKLSKPKMGRPRKAKSR